MLTAGLFRKGLRIESSRGENTRAPLLVPVLAPGSLGEEVPLLPAGDTESKESRSSVSASCGLSQLLRLLQGAKLRDGESPWDRALERPHTQEHCPLFSRFTWTN